MRCLMSTMTVSVAFHKTNDSGMIFAGLAQILPSQFSRYTLDT